MEATSEIFEEGKRKLTVTLNPDGSVCQEEGYQPTIEVEHRVKPGSVYPGVNIPPINYAEYVELPESVVKALAAVDHSGVAASALNASVSALNGRRMSPPQGVTTVSLVDKATVSVKGL